MRRNLGLTLIEFLVAIGFVGDGYLKKIPKDPINNTTYYYGCEPETNRVPCLGFGNSCRYYLGGKLEQPSDPSKSYFRCSDNQTLTAGVGCKEVASEGQ